MHDAQIELILARLTRLERQNRRWKAISTLAVLVCGIVLLVGAGQSAAPHVAGEIRARQFVLVDERGTILARLGALPHGAIGLGFYDAGRKSRVLLAVDPDGASSLSLIGKEGQSSLLLKADAAGATGLRLFDKRWKIRASLATWPDGSPFLQLSDREGKDRALLGFAELRATTTGELIKRPESSLVLMNGDHTVIWRAP
jgi:hypothetical protein